MDKAGHTLRFPRVCRRSLTIGTDYTPVPPDPPILVIRSSRRLARAIPLLPRPDPDPQRIAYLEARLMGRFEVVVGLVADQRQAGEPTAGDGGQVMPDRDLVGGVGHDIRQADHGLGLVEGAARH